MTAQENLNPDQFPAASGPKLPDYGKQKKPGWKQKKDSGAAVAGQSPGGLSWFKPTQAASAAEDVQPVEPKKSSITGNILLGPQVDDTAAGQGMFGVAGLAYAKVRKDFKK